MAKKINPDKFKPRIAFVGELVSLIILVILTVSLVRNIVIVKKANERVALEQEKLEEVKRKNEELKSQMEEVGKPQYIEKKAREKLGLVKEGEAIVVLPNEEVLKKLSPTVEEEENTLPDPTWRRWLKLFM